MTALNVYVNGQDQVSADNLNTFMQTCTNMAELRAFPANNSSISVYVRGTSTPDDGGQGTFYWNPTVIGVDDNGATTVVPYGVTIGCWLRITNQVVNGAPLFTDFGAVGDGITNDSVAFVAAGVYGGTVYVPKGTYRLEQNVISTVDWIFTGGVFLVDSPYTLTLNGTVQATATQIFTGAGSVVGLPTTSFYVLPEWWGAVGNGRASSPTDDTLAVQAAINFSTYHTVLLSSMYAVTGVSRETPGVNFYGEAGTGVKSNVTVSGLSAMGAQDYILRLGNNSGSPTEVNSCNFEGITFDGRDNLILYGLLYARTLSQAKVTRVTFRHAFGAGVYGQKLEDVNFTNCQFTCLGHKSTSGACTGAFVLGPPITAVGNNALRFEECRFEWVDGGFFRFDNVSTSAIDQLNILNCKFEQAISGDSPPATYGIFAGDYGFFHMINDSLSLFNQTDVVVQGCNFSGLQNALTLFRFGNFNNVTIEGNFFSGGYSVATTANMFILQKSDNATAVASTGFVFRNNTFRDFDETNNFTFISNYNCTSPMVFDYPIWYLSQGTRLNTLRFNDTLEAQHIGNAARLAPDPDANDPCLSPLGAVCKVSGQNFDQLMFLGDKRALSRIAGIQNKTQGLLRLRVRCKKAGSTAAATLQIISNGSNLLTTITIPSFYWQVVEAYVNFHEIYADETGLRIQNVNTNNASHSIYIDTVQIEWVDYIKAAVVPSSDTWNLGDKFYYTTPLAAGNIGAVCTTAGTFGSLSSVTANLVNGSNAMVVNSTTNLRVGMYVTTAAGSITAATIININGTSVTVNQNAGSDQTATAVSYATPVFKTFGAIAA